MKREKSDLSRFTQSKPYVMGAPVKPNEATIKFYPSKNRIILSAVVLEHLEIKGSEGKPLYYELFFDLSKKEIAVLFSIKKNEFSYTASFAKGSRFLDIGGACQRQGLEIKKLESPVELKLLKNSNEGFFYFNYESFAKNTKNT